MTHDSDFHRIESTKKGRYKLRKQYQYLIASVVAFTVWMVLYSFMEQGTGDFTVDMLLIDWASVGVGHFVSPSGLDYVPYFFLVLGAGGILYLITGTKSLITLRHAANLQRQKIGKVELLTSIKMSLAAPLDIVIYYLMYPISMLVIAGDHGSPSFRKRFYIRYGYFDHLDRVLFRQRVRKVDGYERADLSAVAGYRYFFSPSKPRDYSQSDIPTDPQYVFCAGLFKNEKEMEDLFLIAEGYLSLKKQPKYDRLISSEKALDRWLREFDGDLEQAKLFNSRDTIIFSLPLMRRFINTECQGFEVFLSKYAIRKEGKTSRRFMHMVDQLKKDSRLGTYFYGRDGQGRTQELLNDEALFEARLVLVLVGYLRLVLTKSLIGQYINLPAGTIVAKLWDYPSRMVIESFDDEALIDVIPGKNDGSNMDFESDVLPNIFLLAFNAYAHGERVSLFDRVYNIFNFRDEVGESSGVDPNGSDTFAEEISKTMGQETDEVVASFGDLLNNFKAANEERWEKAAAMARDENKTGA